MSLEKIKLNSVRTRINIAQYSLQDIALHFSQFDNKVLNIVLEDNRKLNILFKNEQLPHLLGLQYVYVHQRTKKNYKGASGFNKLMNNEITVQDFKSKIMKSKPNINGRKMTWPIILDRIEFLPMFMNLIERDLRIKDFNKLKIAGNVSMKGDYILFKYNNRYYISMSIKKIVNSFVVETFFVNNNINYLGNQEEYRITASI